MPKKFKYKRSYWPGRNKERERHILRLLEVRDAGFDELHERLRWSGKKWGRQTLNVYLDTLKERGLIRRKHRGRKSISLVRENPEVAKLLSWNPKIRIWGRQVLDELNEHEFIEDCIDSMKFCLLNIIEDYAVHGWVLEELLPSHIQDLEDTVNFYGEKMSRLIESGKYKPDRIMEVKRELLQEITRKMRRT
jgi:hypothetical protein